MFKFSIAGEGITDQVTIENILCGFFENEDLDGEIKYSQPLFDESDNKQKGFGNWTMLLEYLEHPRFRRDTLNCAYIVVQVDTDIANEKGFDVSQYDEQNQPLAPDVLIANVIGKLIDTIEIGEQGFYQENAHRIVFAISVHSLECWLYAHYNKKLLKKPKITGCYNALSRLLQFDEKNYGHYKEISKPFKKRKNIDAVATKDASFRIFLQALEKVEINLD